MNSFASLKNSQYVELKEKIDWVMNQLENSTHTLDEVFEEENPAALKLALGELGGKIKMAYDMVEYIFCQEEIKAEKKLTQIIKK